MKQFLKGVGKNVKEIIGMGEDEDIEMDDFPERDIKLDLPTSGEILPERKQELKVDTVISSSHDEKPQEEDLENCQTIFIDPKSFTDCKKIANYIKNDRMVTLNLEYLDSETAQRMMDFLMGAMLIKGASFIEISKKVYTSVPKSVKVHYDGKKNINDRMYLNIKED